MPYSIWYELAAPGKCSPMIYLRPKPSISISDAGKKGGCGSFLNARLREQVRVAPGRSLQPSAGIINSQSVKTTDRGGESGYDAGKKVLGRKRHILVDTQGLLLTLVVHPANIQDRSGAKAVFLQGADNEERLELVWADQGYGGQLVESRLGRSRRLSCVL